jgi:uncharacterized membrane protein (DUF485 family)
VWVKTPDTTGVFFFITESVTMGDPDRSMRESRQERARRAQRMTLIHTVMTCLILVILIQFLLLMVAVEAYLGGRPATLVPSTLASGACFAVSCWMIRYIAVRKPS